MNPKYTVLTKILKICMIKLSIITKALSRRMIEICFEDGGIFMFQRRKRFLALSIAAMLVAATVSGCGQNSDKVGADDKAPGEEIEKIAISELTFPIVESPITLTWFYVLDEKTSATKKSFDEVEAYKKVQELTNIDIEFQHPPVGQETEQFNLMMASGDLADIVFYGWRNQYPGGPSKAISENLILPLNDLIDQYSPNLKKIYQENPQFEKDAKTDQGELYAYPGGSYEIFQRTTEPKPAFFTFGWQIRQDWLDKVGLEVPETMDEWYEVLTAFKTLDPNENGQADEIPLIHKGIDVNNWLRAWGANYGYYIEENTVKFGQNEPVYKEYLETMNKWYEEGLLDIDYVTTDGKQFDAKVTNSISGAWTGSTSGTFGRFVQLMKDKEPTAKLTGTVQPYIASSEPYNFDGASFYPVEAHGAAISAKCKYPEEAAMFLDIGFSDEGDALYNWGIEGESYTIENGDYKLTDQITNNPDGLSLDQALAQYAPGANNGVMFNSKSLWNQRMWMPEQHEAVSRWSVGSGDRILPPITPTAEESAKVADIMNKVNTYTDEMLHKFIMGIVPISEYDNYLKNIRDMGIEEAIAINQSALDRYLKR